MSIHVLMLARQQRLRHPHMIDPQTKLRRNAPRAIVPPGKLSTFLMMQPERVGKTQRLISFERGAFGLAAHDSFLPEFRVVNVTIFRRHIEVAAKHYPVAWLVVVVKKRAQSFHPVKLEGKLLRPNGLTVWNIDVNDTNAVDGGGEQTRVRALLIFVVATLHIGAFLPGKNRHTVVALLSKTLGQ